MKKEDLEKTIITAHGLMKKGNVFQAEQLLEMVSKQIQAGREVVEKH
jgi:hypothetical protein